MEKSSAGFRPRRPAFQKPFDMTLLGTRHQAPCETDCSSLSPSLSPLPLCSFLTHTFFRLDFSSHLVPGKVSEFSLSPAYLVHVGSIRYSILVTWLAAVSHLTTALPF